MLPLFVDERLNYFDKGKTIQLTEWLLSKINENMDKPDSGLWEFGSTYQYNSYTYLFHWAGAHASMKIGQLLGDKTITENAQSIITPGRQFKEILIPMRPI